MDPVARSFTLPRLELTQLAEPSDPTARVIEIEVDSERESYAVVASVLGDGGSTSRTGCNLFPMVLCADGSPWPEASLYLLDLLELDYAPNMMTYGYKASDLAFYRQFLDEGKAAKVAPA